MKLIKDSEETGSTHSAAAAPTEGLLSNEVSRCSLFNSLGKDIMHIYISIAMQNVCSKHQFQQLRLDIHQCQHDRSKQMKSTFQVWQRQTLYSICFTVALASCTIIGMGKHLSSPI
jgi:hypothetical protein